MSAEALRFLASSHGASVVPPPPNHSAHFLARPQLRGTAESGSAPSQHLQALPPPSFLDHFRALPPGLPPINFYPPGIGPSSIALDMKTDGLPAALAHGQPMLPPFYYDACFPSPYGYHDRFGGALDINGARRKNATRETTAALKAWLFEHRKNPYPTKGEKIMLAIITKMTLTQVSTWFANARRRLKKENKMTWSPRNRSGEDDDDDGEGDADEDRTGGSNTNHRTTVVTTVRAGHERPASTQSSLLDLNDVDDYRDSDSDGATLHQPPGFRSGHSSQSHMLPHRPTSSNSSAVPASTGFGYLRDVVPPIDSVHKNHDTGDKRKAEQQQQPSDTPAVKKPKIWSIADTVNLTSTPTTTAAAAPLSDSPSKAPPPALVASAQLMAPPGPFNMTFPPWPQMAAAAAMMFQQRAPSMQPLFGQGLLNPHQQHQQFLMNVPPALIIPAAARPELYRSFLSPLQEVPPSCATSLPSTGFYQPPDTSSYDKKDISSVSLSSENNAEAQKQRSMIGLSSSNSRMTSPVSAASSAHSTKSSSPTADSSLTKGHVRKSPVDAGDNR